MEDFAFSFFLGSFFEECEEPNKEERVWTDALTRPLCFTPTPADPKSEPFFKILVYKHTNVLPTVVIGGGGRCQAPPTAGRRERMPK